MTTSANPRVEELLRDAEAAGLLPDRIEPKPRPVTIRLVEPVVEFVPPTNLEKLRMRVSRLGRGVLSRD
jgi:hypothetical protein